TATPTATPTATVTPTATPTATPTQPGQEPGYITVFSYPLGGSVALDGTVIGTTPLQDYAVEPGTHTLTAAYPGYREYTTTVTVSPGEHKRVPLIIFMKGIPTMFPTTIPTTSVTTNIPTAVPTATLTPTATVTGSTGTGALKISTVPRGATIYIDDVVKGISPATISDIPAGNHELKVAKQNYKTTVKTVTVQAGKTIQVPLIVLSPTRSGF
ncbi:MAG TPA: PEGA domain-containing protein, partial [Methanolinea sp.]|nr:PEGA domain-containing protein [Methanolinea sp.]HQJ18566.1 PEGA domain-containing protein [Methanolinea sp.]